jgi:hypothetical protein
MTGKPRANEVRTTLPGEESGLHLDDPQVRAWFDEHIVDLRRGATGQRFLYMTLAASFLVGLAAHVAGYVLGPTATTEPLGLLTDLLYALGFALWTGVVVVVFVQVIPEAKRRQFARAIAAYEAVRREEARTRDRTSYPDIP